MDPKLDSVVGVLRPDRSTQALSPGSFAFNGTSSGLDWLVGGLTRGEW